MFKSASVVSIFTVLAAILFDSSVAIAVPRDQVSRHGYCKDDVTKGFHYYCDPEAIPDEDVAKPAPFPSAPAPELEVPKPVPDPPSATERIMAFRARLEEIKHRAVLEPTRENVQAYMFAQKSMTEMAGRFTDQWQRILFATPELDANIEFPLTALGSNIYQDDLRARREAAFRKATQSRGLLFVFENPHACPVCGTQVQIIAKMRDKFDVAILPVTLDGTYPPELPDAVRDQGQVANLGLQDTPRPILGLVDPASGAVDLIGAGLLTEDHILERIYVLTAVPVGERY